MINGTLAFSTAVAARQDIRNLAYTLAQPDIEHDIDDLTFAAIQVTAAAPTATYTPWDFHLHETREDLPDGVTAAEMMAGAVSSKPYLSVFPKGSPLAAVSMWATDPEFVANIDVDGASVLVCAWVYVNGDLVPTPAVLVTGEGIRYHENEAFGGDHEQAAKEVVTMARLLANPHVTYEAKVSRQVRRNHEKDFPGGAVPSILIRGVEIG